MVIFHPTAPPVISYTKNGIVKVTVEPGVPEKLYVPVADSVKVPVVIVPFTVGESAKVGVAIAGNRSLPMISITSSKIW